eukprot:PLAT4154.1.p1 GENE.PLAT4154.1~~PLAT4154.1.p1  ORF type:complete len:810 (+),score=328.82 PLAT4154.1:84-2513(+)
MTAGDQLPQAHGRVRCADDGAAGAAGSIKGRRSRRPFRLAKRRPLVKWQALLFVAFVAVGVIVAPLVPKQASKAAEPPLLPSPLAVLSAAGCAMMPSTCAAPSPAAELHAAALSPDSAGQDGATVAALTGRRLQDDLFPDDALLQRPYESAPNKGVLILHFVGVVYMFAGLAIACDDYFVSALEEICEAYSISEDVAGATWMAAGGSAPELLTSFVGVFVASNDVGFGTIVGSAVFNVLFVIGLCAIFAGSVLELTWWPLARDCSFYAISLGVLVGCVEDSKVEWYEALLLLLLYFAYVFLMKHNVRLNRAVEGWLRRWRSKRAKRVIPSEFADPGTMEKIRAHRHSSGEGDATEVAAVDEESSTHGLVSDDGTTTEGDSVDTTHARLRTGERRFSKRNVLTSSTATVLMRDMRGPALKTLVRGKSKRRKSHIDKYLESSEAVSTAVEMEKRRVSASKPPTVVPVMEEDEEGGDDADGKHVGLDADGTVVPLDDDAARSSSSSASIKATSSGYLIAGPPTKGDGLSPVASEGTESDVVRDSRPSDASADSSFAGGVTPLDGGGADAAAGTVKTTADLESGGADKKGGDGDGDGDDDDDDDDDDDGPDDPWEVPEGGSARALWAFTLPLQLALWYSVPNCKKEGMKNWFLATFFVSLCWIAGFSFVMVWLATVIGQALNIPPIVMGLTILAAGTSVPDALSSVIVARNGFGDMAVSSSIGSNVFDITVGLPVPWLVKTALVSPGSFVPIFSPSLLVSVVTLLAMVLLVVFSIMLTGWKLNKRLGAIMFVLYILFVAENLLLEYCSDLGLC